MNNDYSEKHIWKPLSKILTAKTKPLYLSFTLEEIYTKNNKIFIKSKQDKFTVKWSEINRIVISGKPKIEPELIYKAMQKRIPIHFLNIYGKPVGSFEVYVPILTAKDNFQARDEYSYEDFKLDFVKEIISRKIMNQYRLLKNRSITERRLKELQVILVPLTLLLP